MPRPLPRAKASSTKVNQPMMAVLRCRALHIPMRAAKFLFRSILTPPVGRVCDMSEPSQCGSPRPLEVGGVCPFGLPLALVRLSTRPARGVGSRMGAEARLDDNHRMAPTILIVDDHPSFRASARRLLEADGFEVVGEALDGESAFEAVRELRPEIVLLDVQLPGLDGF